MCHEKKLFPPLTRSSYTAVLIDFLFRMGLTDILKNFYFVENGRRARKMEWSLKCWLSLVCIWVSSCLCHLKSRWCPCAWEAQTHKFNNRSCSIQKQSESEEGGSESNLTWFDSSFMIVNRPYKSMNYSHIGVKMKIQEKKTVFNVFFSDVQMWVSDTVVHTCKDQTTLAESKSDFCVIWGVEYCS